MIEQETRNALGDVYDRTIRGLDGVPDVTKTHMSTVHTRTKVLERTQTFIVQTFRQKDEGDTVCIQFIDAAGSFRIALPPQVSRIIASQREALNTKSRRNAGKRAAEAMKAAGIKPFERKTK